MFEVSPGNSDAAFYRLLLRFDEELAAAEQPKGCRVCGKRLAASGGVGLQLLCEPPFP